jgi:hypothetical protein
MKPPPRLDCDCAKAGCDIRVAPERVAPERVATIKKAERCIDATRY